MDVSAILAPIMTMSIEERIRIVQAILDSIAAEQAPPEISEEQKRELDRRIAAHEANPNDVVSWQDIAAYVRRRR